MEKHKHDHCKYIRVFRDIASTEANENTNVEDDEIESIYSEEELDAMTELEQFNAQTLEEDDDDFLLLYYFPKLPTPNDYRYKLIFKYGDKDHAYGMERTRCLEFEILARDKNNVYAIEKAVDFYTKNELILQKYCEINNAVAKLPHSNDGKIYSVRKKLQGMARGERFQKYLERKSAHSLSSIEVAQTMLELLKLRLIPYKYYSQEEKFEHWAINPKIYDIINMFTFKDNPYADYKVIPLANSPEGKIKSYQIEARTDSRKYFQSLIKLNGFTTFRSTVPIGKVYMNPNTNSYHKWYVENKVMYKSHYPALREYSKLNIEMDMTLSSTALSDYLKQIARELHQYKREIEKTKSLLKNSNSSGPSSLIEFDVYEMIGSKLEEKFFEYDYFTYRMEQIKYREKHLEKPAEEFHEEDLVKKISKKEILENLAQAIKDDDYENIQYYEDLTDRFDDVSHANKSDILKEIKPQITHIITHANKKDKKSSEVSDDSISDHIREIKNMVKSSRSTSDFLRK